MCPVFVVVAVTKGLSSLKLERTDCCLCVGVP